MLIAPHFTYLCIPRLDINRQHCNYSVEFTLKKLDKCTELKSNSEKIYTKIIITVNSINGSFISIKKTKVDYLKLRITNLKSVILSSLYTNKRLKYQSFSNEDDNSATSAELEIY